MTWGFLWLMLALKIPIAALIYLVWWAVKQTPEETPSSDDDGGVKRHPKHPREPFPRRLRRCRRTRRTIALASPSGSWRRTIH